MADNDDVDMSLLFTARAVSPCSSPMMEVMLRCGCCDIPHFECVLLVGVSESVLEVLEVLVKLLAVSTESVDDEADEDTH